MPQTADAALGRVVSVDARARRCLFVGVKQTSLKNAPRTAFDPERTSALTEMFKVPKSQNRVDANGAFLLHQSESAVVFRATFNIVRAAAFCQLLIRASAPTRCFDPFASSISITK